MAAWRGLRTCATRGLLREGLTRLTCPSSLPAYAGGMLTGSGMTGAGSGTTSGSMADEVRAAVVIGRAGNSYAAPAAGGATRGEAQPCAAPSRSERRCSTPSPAPRHIRVLCSRTLALGRGTAQGTRAGHGAQPAPCGQVCRVAGLHEVPRPILVQGRGGAAPVPCLQALRENCRGHVMPAPSSARLQEPRAVLSEPSDVKRTVSAAGGYPGS